MVQLLAKQAQLRLLPVEAIEDGRGVQSDRPGAIASVHWCGGLKLHGLDQRTADFVRLIRVDPPRSAALSSLCGDSGSVQASTGSPVTRLRDRGEVLESPAAASAEAGHPVHAQWQANRRRSGPGTAPAKRERKLAWQPLSGKDSTTIQVNATRGCASAVRAGLPLRFWETPIEPTSSALGTATLSRLTRTLLHLGQPGRHSSLPAVG